jgi:hypothetical protein
MISMKKVGDKAGMKNIGGKVTDEQQKPFYVFRVHDEGFNTATKYSF